MTDRIPLDDMTSDALDQLYARADRAEALLREIVPLFTPLATDRNTGLATAFTCDEVVDADRMARWRAAPCYPAPVPAETHPTEPHTGLVVQPYREYGTEKWVFRCWGTDTCDGALSLDHYSEQSAERARDRHVAEDHATEEQPHA